MRSLTLLLLIVFSIAAYYYLNADSSETASNMEVVAQPTKTELRRAEMPKAQTQEPNVVIKIPEIKQDLGSANSLKVENTLSNPRVNLDRQANQKLEAVKKAVSDYEREDDERFIDNQDLLENFPNGKIPSLGRSDEDAQDDGNFRADPKSGSGQSWTDPDVDNDSSPADASAR